MMNGPVLELQDLSAGYGDDPVIRNINLSVNKGEILSIVGESGSGKSTLIKSILPAAGQKAGISSGRIFFQGQDLINLPPADKRRICGSKIGMVFQNPAAAFNPIRSYYKQFAEALKSHDRWHGDASVAKILQLFDQLSLPGDKQFLRKCPYQMSGGMNQRISIALALLLKPVLLLADEPTSALDATSQSLIIRQLAEFRREQQLTMLLITHNMGVAAKLGDQIAVMHNGLIVEYGNRDQILKYPEHPYTKSLLDAVPRLKKPDSRDQHEVSR